MKRAVITGANGFIGSALARELTRHGTEVIALDREGCSSAVPQEAVFVPFDLADISDVTALLADMKPDVYFHLAWYGMNGATRGDPAVQLKNVEWTLAALAQAKEIGCSRFIGAGSIMEYETYSAVMRQGSRPGAGYVYGAAKLAARSMCMVQAARLGIDIVWAEITNAYGAGENSPRLINSTLRKIIENKPLEFTAATQNYDFVYIDDVARAFRLIAENGAPFSHYLIGSSAAKPLREFLLEIKEAAAPDREFIFGAVPFTGVSLSPEELDCSLTERDTGFRAQVPFKTGILRTMDWLKSGGPTDAI